MPLITLDNLSLSFSEKPILNEVSATILKSDKIALIGRNGEGKSTFMRVLAGEIEADEGKLKIKNGIKISYLEQTPPQDNHKNLFDIVAEGLGDIGKILSQYQHLIAKGELDQATKLQEKIDQLDAWQYLHKIALK
jgi:ATP-binding cassette subfamily F protein uup